LASEDFKLPDSERQQLRSSLDTLLASVVRVQRPRLSRWARFKGWLKRARDWFRGYANPSMDLEPSIAGVTMFIGQMVPWAELHSEGEYGIILPSIRLEVVFGRWYRWLPWRRKAAIGVIEGFVGQLPRIGVRCTVHFR